MRIGIDFDNTIIDYTPVYETVGKTLDIPIPPHTPKHRVRDIVRATGGESLWIKVQSMVYGEAIGHAKPFSGCIDFLSSCSKRHIPVSIISHKTDRAVFDPRIRLREAAVSWLAAHSFFDTVGVLRDVVFFENTREKKIERIRKLACTHYIDDLPDVFLHPAFPGDTTKLLFGPQHSVLAGTFPIPDWEAAKAFVFHSYGDTYQTAD